MTARALPPPPASSPEELEVERDQVDPGGASTAIYRPCPALALLREARGQLGPEAFTRRSGMRPSTLASYLGRRRRPNADAMFLMLDGLGIPLEAWRLYEDHNCNRSGS